jgi:hypothetical protein
VILPGVLVRRGEVMDVVSAIHGCLTRADCAENEQQQSQNHEDGSNPHLDLPPLRQYVFFRFVDTVYWGLADALSAGCCRALDE